MGVRGGNKMGEKNKMGRKLLFYFWIIAAIIKTVCGGDRQTSDARSGFTWI